MSPLLAWQRTVLFGHNSQTPKSALHVAVIFRRLGLLGWGGCQQSRCSTQQHASSFRGQAAAKDSAAAVQHNNIGTTMQWRRQLHKCCHSAAGSSSLMLMFRRFSVNRQAMACYQVACSGSPSELIAQQLLVAVGGSANQLDHSIAYLCSAYRYQPKSKGCFC